MQWTIMKRCTELGAAIMEALGGKRKYCLRSINCISRLRLILKDSAKVNEKGIKGNRFTWTDPHQ